MKMRIVSDELYPVYSLVAKENKDGSGTGVLCEISPEMEKRWARISRQFDKIQKEFRVILENTLQKERRLRCPKS